MAGTVPYHSAYAPAEYAQQLEAKRGGVEDAFGGWLRQGVQVETFGSPPQHFRYRCRFAVAEDGEGALKHALLLGGQERVLVEDFPIASRRITELMPAVMRAVGAWEELRAGLRAVHYLSTTTGDCLLTLIYGPDRPLDGRSFRPEAETLRRALGLSGCCGRSKGVAVTAGQEEAGRGFVTESVALADGRLLTYRQLEGSFSNPNPHVAKASLDWLSDVAGRVDDSDLLELYCGNAHHTCALAPRFRKVLGVEIDKALVAVGNFNLRKNGVAHRSRVLQSPSATYCTRLARNRTWTDPILGELSFGAILVDPPRAGLDEETHRACARFDRIMYISCNPKTLRDALEGWEATHTVERFALFDHFPYSGHLECGAYLVRRGFVPARRGS